MMESIEQLHKEIQILDDNNIDTDELVRISDAIEREVESKYVELPKDENGEPITYDTMTEQWGALDSIWCMMEADGSCTWYVRGHDMSAPVVEASEVTVVKPPTVEDVLKRFANLVRNEQVEQAQISDETVAEFAAKLRLASNEE